MDMEFRIIKLKRFSMMYKALTSEIISAFSINFEPPPELHSDSLKQRAENSSYIFQKTMKIKSSIRGHLPTWHKQLSDIEKNTCDDIAKELFICDSQNYTYISMDPINIEPTIPWISFVDFNTLKGDIMKIFDQMLDDVKSSFDQVFNQNCNELSRSGDILYNFMCHDEQMYLSFETFKGKMLYKLSVWKESITAMIEQSLGEFEKRIVNDHFHGRHFNDGNMSQKYDESSKSSSNQEMETIETFARIILDKHYNDPGNNVLKFLLFKLPTDVHSHVDAPDQKIPIILEALNKVIINRTDYARKVFEFGGVERLTEIIGHKDSYPPTVVNFACEILFNMWQKKDLHKLYTSAGWLECHFILETKPDSSHSVTTQCQDQNEQRLPNGNEFDSSTDTTVKRRKLNNENDESHPFIVYHVVRDKVDSTVRGFSQSVLSDWIDLANVNALPSSPGIFFMKTKRSKTFSYVGATVNLNEYLSGENLTNQELNGAFKFFDRHFPNIEIQYISTPSYDGAKFILQKLKEKYVDKD